MVGAHLTIVNSTMSKNNFNKVKKLIDINQINKKRNDKGFTLSELLVSSVISTFVLIAGYSLVRMTMQINKSDETYLKLGTKVDNALDFVVDEINSSKRILTSYSQVPSKCTKPSGDFVIGLKLPDQALDLSSYKTNKLQNKSSIWKDIDCPIIYTLVKDNKSKGPKGSYYNLMRRGPALDKKGYYMPSKVSNNLITENVRHEPIDQMFCETGWVKRKVHGIIMCTDKNRRAAEIGISADISKNHSETQQLSRSSAAYTRIQDEDLLGNNSNAGTGTGSPCANPAACNLFGTQMSSRKVTFFIDVSGSMSWGRIKGKDPMTVAKEELIKSLRALAAGVEFQVIAFNHYSRPLFRGGPKAMDGGSRLQAINFVSNLRAGGGTNPWAGIQKSMESQSVGQIILMSDGWTSTSGPCKHLGGRYMKYSDCYKDYNDNVRSQTNTGTVQIDTVSIRNNFCTGSGWLGDLSKKNNGSCSVIR